MRWRPASICCHLMRYPPVAQDRAVHLTLPTPAEETRLGLGAVPTGGGGGVRRSPLGPLRQSENVRADDDDEDEDEEEDEEDATTKRRLPLSAQRAQEAQEGGSPLRGRRQWQRAENPASATDDSGGASTYTRTPFGDRQVRSRRCCPIHMEWGKRPLGETSSL
jgi:hypothetical protein